MSDGASGIGTRIAEVRRLKGLSQVQLAEQLGISKPGLANYERGARMPPASLVADMCEKYAVSPAWLLIGNGAMLDQDIESLHKRAISIAWSYLVRGGDDVQMDDLLKLSGALLHYLMKHEQLDDAMIDAMGKLVA